MSNFISDSAVINNSKYVNLKVYKNVLISNCDFGNNCSVGDDTTIERTSLEGNNIINRRSYINDSFIGKYTYTGINTTINFSKIGRFCSIARNVDIGGFDHNYHKITTMPHFRFEQMMNEGRICKYDEFTGYCKIGNDVWIAAGAQILHKVTIGDGAVVGAGAIVTKDVPPYSIVVGVPAKVIGYRCSPELIDRLLAIKWWNFPEEVLHKYMNKFIDMDISEESVSFLENVLDDIK